MKKLCLLIMALICTGATASAKSLWQEDNCGSPVRDTRARAVGDIVTIVVDEKAEVTKESSRSSSKEESTDLGTDVFSLFGLKGSTENMPAMKWGSKREFDGAADYASTDSFSKRLSVTVKEVLPNGNLLLEGKREIETEGDQTIITLTGIVRPTDIRADNTVLSEFVADAKISYNSDGPAGKNTKRGWFTKILDFIWPF